MITIGELMKALVLGQLPKWHKRASCAGSLDPAFIADTARDAGSALAVCASCPVWQPCALWGRQERATGVYGGEHLRDGLSEAQRAALKTKGAA